MIWQWTDRSVPPEGQFVLVYDGADYQWRDEGLPAEIGAAIDTLHDHGVRTGEHYDRLARELDQ